MTVECFGEGGLKGGRQGAAGFLIAVGKDQVSPGGVNVSGVLVVFDALFGRIGGAGGVIGSYVWVLALRQQAEDHNRQGKGVVVGGAIYGLKADSLKFRGRVVRLADAATEAADLERVRVYDTDQAVASGEYV